MASPGSTVEFTFQDSMSPEIRRVCMGSTAATLASYILEKGMRERERKAIRCDIIRKPVELSDELPSATTPLTSLREQ